MSATYRELHELSFENCVPILNFIFNDYLKETEMLGKINKISTIPVKWLLTRAQFINNCL